MTEQAKQGVKDNVQSFKRAETYAVTLYDRVIRPLMQEGIDRKNRLIRVCFKCHKYESDDEWINGAIPPGIESRNGYCPECFQGLLGTQNSLFNSVTKNVESKFIRVCCYCGRWWTGTGWQVSNIPVGKYTHTYCELCYDIEMKQVEMKE